MGGQNTTLNIERTHPQTNEIITTQKRSGSRERGFGGGRGDTKLNLDGVEVRMFVKFKTPLEQCIQRNSKMYAQKSEEKF